MLESPSWNKGAQLSGGKKVDPFAVLFLTRDAPVFMIEAAWKALARQHHPDLGGNTTDFQRVKDAYEEIKKHATKSDGDDTKKSG
jgi:DnaJ-class molecular chaperone